MIIDDLIGLPFQYGGRGPAAYDCFGLTQEVLRRYGIELNWGSQLAIEDNLSAWKPVSDLQEGDVVMMGGTRRWTHVCPVVTPQGDMLHCSRGSGGVMLVTWRQLVALGLRSKQAYRWRGVSGTQPLSRH